MFSKLPTFVAGCEVKASLTEPRTIVEGCGDFPFYLTQTPTGFRRRKDYEPSGPRPVYSPIVEADSELVARMAPLTMSEAKIVAFRVQANNNGSRLWVPPLHPGIQVQLHLFPVITPEPLTEVKTASSTSAPPAEAAAATNSTHKPLLPPKKPAATSGVGSQSLFGGKACFCVGKCNH